MMGSKNDDFTDHVIHALGDARRKGIRFTAGAGEGDLELQNLRLPAEDEDGEAAGRPRHLETPPGARDPGSADGKSGLRYFLDGVQSSYEIGRIGAAPIIVANVAAAVAERDERRISRMDLDGPPEIVRAVILPRSAGEDAEAFYQLLRDAGLTELFHDEVPSSSDLVLDSGYVDEEGVSDYVGMRERAFGRVRSLRERVESELLSRWEGDDRVLENEDDWIAVDGQLRGRVRDLTAPARAIGLIKNIARPEFVGEDARMLLDLEPRMRTTSFIPDWQLRRDPNERRTSWYVRMWPPQQSANALGSLSRIEAPRDTPPEWVDEISRWLLAERAPLAKPDPRWPSMIYPIRHVEKILTPVLHNNRRARLRLEREIASLAR